jgi:hypothetical protein
MELIPTMCGMATGYGSSMELLEQEVDTHINKTVDNIAIQRNYEAERWTKMNWFVLSNYVYSFHQDKSTFNSEILNRL